MPDLRTLGQQVVDNPFREPPPMWQGQGRDDPSPPRHDKLLSIAALGVAIAMVIGVIGLARSASGDNTAKSTASATTITTTTATTAETATTIADETTTTANGVAGIQQGQANVQAPTGPAPDAGATTTAP